MVEQVRRNALLAAATLGGGVSAARQVQHAIRVRRRRAMARRIGWLGAVALAGTGLAVLLTSRSGQRMRHEIGERARRGAERLRERGNAGDRTHSTAEAQLGPHAS